MTALCSTSSVATTALGRVGSFGNPLEFAPNLINRKGWVWHLVRMQTCLWSFSLLMLRQSGQTDYGPDFNSAEPRPGNAAGDLDRFVEIPDIDEVIPSKMLACLQKGAIGNDRSSISHSNGRGHGCRLKRRRIQILPFCVNLVGESNRFVAHLPLLRFRHSGEVVLVVVNQQDVFQRVPRVNRLSRMIQSGNVAACDETLRTV